ncbi:hypothetical protein CRE_17706 [Caenorhabditis remanei]|uniref:Uncharacterized protein n=1 Tax=Caenorhabditis remanei TaxID=31234 RepID=E3NT94_CAERE|nr:hypothetical protein CRE_17706 [Caenorhabditis remanei]
MTSPKDDIFSARPLIAAEKLLRNVERTVKQRGVDTKNIRNNGRNSVRRRRHRLPEHQHLEHQLQNSQEHHLKVEDKQVLDQQQEVNQSLLLLLEKYLRLLFRVKYIEKRKLRDVQTWGHVNPIL